MKTQLSHSELLIEIVNTLEAHGIDLETTILYDYFDIDALEQLIASGDDSLEIRVTIEGVDLLITRDGLTSSPR